MKANTTDCEIELQIGEGTYRRQPPIHSAKKKLKAIVKDKWPRWLPGQKHLFDPEIDGK